MKTNNTIHSTQLFFIIFQTQVGVGVLSLPTSLYAGSGTDGWITLLITGVVIQGVIFILYLLSNRFPSSTLYEYAPKIVGKYIAFLISLLYIAFAISTAVIVLELFETTIKTWILFRTPMLAILLLLTITGTYLAVGKLKVMGRFYQFVSILIVPLVIMAAYTLKDADLRYILPIGENGIGTILKATQKGIVSMLGFEIILFVYPYVQDKGKAAFKSATLANIAVTSLYAFLTFTSYVFFSPKQLQMIPEPIVYMLKGVSFIIVDRVDLLFLSIWIISVMTSYASYLYIGGKGIQYLTKRKKTTGSIILVAAISLILSMFTHDRYTVEVIAGYHAKASYFFALGIPISLYILSLIFKKKEVTA
ncbi:GerAB/ArcD/ProY family transporter [Bacillus sp. NTK071]|uniref:GerAB/ArcD/ProY family transporter n=1 Tax=Bacillus sp. NTK071 TaxID=2802175 RepID=UPI001A8FD2F6|nr:GerAB/ArcD/ProY family transporter [Bacillus sp. NTK071]MBN8209172.1 GerAB/ArcD/ProY family transporter [Bacillus sp. NTK071]